MLQIGRGKRTCDQDDNGKEDRRSLKARREYFIVSYLLCKCGLVIPMLQ